MDPAKSKELPSRITELPNELTTNIDTCNEVGIVRLLRQSDAQLFAGWGPHPAVGDSEMLSKIDSLVTKAVQLLKENKQDGKKNAFVFTGCGTSGRIAWACSRSFNRVLTQFGMEGCFHYLIAGGDQALIVGNELPEDDPPRGAEDLKKLANGLDHVMLFGITCGLSAPYVAGQIDHAMKNAGYTAVLIGFNPVTLARDVPIEKWNKTCKQTFLELEKLEQESDKAFILNPVVGPEPITGSSRMKGGSMTAILLNVIFTAALSKTFSTPFERLLTPCSTTFPDCNEEPLPGVDDSPAPSNSTCNSVNGSGLNELKHQYTNHALTSGQFQVASLIDAFASTYHAAYRPTEGIASLVAMAGESLRHPDGHLYYLGAEALGILGFIDSSEMVSTYGSSPEEVRGFVVRGWEACQNREGDQSKRNHLFQISVRDFEADILPKLSKHDSVIWIHTDAVGVVSKDDHTQLQSVMDKVLTTPAKRAMLTLSTGQSPSMPQLHDTRYDFRLLVRLPYFSVLGTEPLFAGFALKLILNAISTGANVLKGRVYTNTMINLTVANDKLFYRSIGIISKLSGVSNDKAHNALLKSIYKEDNIEKQVSLPVSSHIVAAAQQNMVVPLAIVLARKQCKVVEAVDIITTTTSIRSVIEQ